MLRRAAEIMASTAKRRRMVNNENGKFQDKWHAVYCFMEHGGTHLCVICQSTVAVMKESNLKRHYQTDNTNNFILLYCALFSWIKKFISGVVISNST